MNSQEKPPSPVVYITRTESFSAAHRLHSPFLSDEENKNVYGKCNSANGHGHNYKVEVTVKGQVDPKTGMVINLVDLKRIIQKSVINVLDHQNLDKDVPYFENSVSTAENIAVFIWKALESEVAVGCLHEVKLYETEKNAVYYRGETTQR